MNLGDAVQIADTPNGPWSDALFVRHGSSDGRYVTLRLSHAGTPYYSECGYCRPFPAADKIRDLQNQLAESKQESLTLAREVQIALESCGDIIAKVEGGRDDD